MLTVKMARVGKGLRQQDVADLMGVHVQTYATMEKFPEKMSIAEAKRFCEIVDVPISDIFFDEKSN